MEKAVKVSETIKVLGGIKSWLEIERNGEELEKTCQGGAKDQGNVAKVAKRELYLNLSIF